MSGLNDHKYVFNKEESVMDKVIGAIAMIGFVLIVIFS
tara:strand:- start:758 stop:871 length:114 start_codon:yes stop_codon:yes gene_type:complete